MQVELGKSREELQALKAQIEDLQGRLQEKEVALNTADRQCQDLQGQLQEAGDERQRALHAKDREGKVSSRQAEELRLKAEQELDSARY